jgi:hypothetical protein
LNGKTKDLLVDASGAVVEVEEQVDFETLDDSVKMGLRKQAAQGKILKVERVTGGSKISYEAVVLIHGAAVGSPGLDLRVTDTWTLSKVQTHGKLHLSPVIACIRLPKEL